MATSGSLALAGCSGDSNPADESTPTPTQTPEGPSDEERAQEHLEAARSEFEEAWNTFKEELDGFDDAENRVSFQTEVIKERLNRAEDELDSAAPLATSDQRDRIEALRNVLNWSRSITSTFKNFGDAVNSYATASSYLDNERFEDAADSFSEAADHLGEADSELTVAQSNLENVDDEAFEEFDDIDRLELQLTMEDMEGLINDFDYLSRSLHHFALGFDAFLPAAEAFDNERFGEAADGFAEARNEFSSAHSIISDGEETATDDFIDDFIGLSCLMGAFRDGADHFKTAAEAAQNNNWSRANEEVDNAETAMDRCEYDL